MHVFVIDKKCFKTSGIDKKRQGEKIEQISYSLCLVNDPKTFVLNASEWKKLVSCLKCQKFINEIRSSETRKKINLPICMEGSNIWRPVVYLQQTIFERNLKWFCTPHLYVSFATFCVQIGQLFGVQGVFTEYLKIDKSPFFKENVADLDAKKVPKKRYFMSNKCFEHFFKNILFEEFVSIKICITQCNRCAWEKDRHKKLTLLYRRSDF